MIFRKYLIFTSILFLFIIIWAGCVSAASFTIDFLNLQEAFPNLNLVSAYFKVGLKEAWETINDLNPNLSHITIGIIDTGLDIKHPEFNQFPKVNLGNTPSDAKVDRGELINGELKSHGTNIAGIIGANNISATSSGNYVSPHMNGVLSGVKDLDYTLEVRKYAKSFALFSAAKKIFETSSSGAQIISLSFNVTFNPIGAVIFDWSFIVHPNTLFIVAAGNNNRSVGIFTPANLGALPNVITVGATTLNDQRVSDSNFDFPVSISAPGEEVFSPTFFTEPSLDAGDYEFFGGTSASAPMVTGVAGLIKAIKPNLTPAQIKQILIETGDPISTDKPIGPRLNAYKAVCHPLVLNCVPPPPPTAPIWPMLQKDGQHSGLTDVSGPPFATSSEVKVKWQRNLGSTWSFSPLIGADGTVYTGAGNKLYALDGQTGETIWQTSVSGSAYTGALGPDGTVYVCSNSSIQGTLSAFNQTNGQEKWRYEENNFSVTSPALSHDESQVYVGFDNHIMAFSTQNSGTNVTPLWDKSSIYFRGFIMSLAVVIDKSDRVLIMDSSNDVSVLRAISKSGQDLWTSSGFGIVVGPSQINNKNQIVVTSGSSRRLYVINPENGSTVSFIDLPVIPVGSKAVIDKNDVSYINFYDNLEFTSGPGIAAVDENGLKWLFPTGPERIVSTSALGANNILYFTSDHTIFALGE